CAGKEKKDASPDRDNAEDVESESHRSSVGSASGASGAALFTNAVEANAARRARPRATSSTPLAPVAAATRRSPAIPPVLRSCAAINRSTSPGPLSTRMRPTATVNRIMPAIARRISVTADRPDEQALFRRQIGRDRLFDVETMNEKRPAFVCAGRQRSRQQARKRAKCGPLPTRGQAQWTGDKARPQLHTRAERPPRDVRSRNEGLTKKTHRERRKRRHSRSRLRWRQEAQADPCRAGDRREPDRKILEGPAGDHQPKSKKDHRPRRGSLRDARRCVIGRRAQGPNPTSVGITLGNGIRRRRRNDILNTWS